MAWLQSPRTWTLGAAAGLSVKIRMMMMMIVGRRLELRHAEYCRCYFREAVGGQHCADSRSTSENQIKGSRLLLSEQPD